LTIASLLALAAGILATMLTNLMRFGAPLDSGGYVSASSFTTTPMQVALIGLIVSPGCGLLWSFPAVILVPSGARRVIAAGQDAFASAAFVLSVLLTLSATTWTDWIGGWAGGMRLVIPGVPVLAILAAIGIDGLAGVRRRVGPWVLLILGSCWALPTVLTDILGGYGERYRSFAGVFLPGAYPPLGAWEFLHRAFAVSPTDGNAVDIVWFRLARDTHYLSLCVPVILVIVAALLTLRAAVTLRRCPDGSSDAHDLDFRECQPPSSRRVSGRG
jgi:hypothetical protein